MPSKYNVRPIGPPRYLWWHLFNQFLISVALVVHNSAYYLMHGSHRVRSVRQQATYVLIRSATHKPPLPTLPPPHHLCRCLVNLSMK